jgi:hypothetical protein
MDCLAADLLALATDHNYATHFVLACGNVSWLFGRLARQCLEREGRRIVPAFVLVVCAVICCANAFMKRVEEGWKANARALSLLHRTERDLRPTTFQSRERDCGAH